MSERVCSMHCMLFFSRFLPSVTISTWVHSPVKIWSEYVVERLSGELTEFAYLQVPKASNTMPMPQPSPCYAYPLSSITTQVYTNSHQPFTPIPHPFTPLTHTPLKATQVTISPGSTIKLLHLPPTPTPSTALGTTNPSPAGE